MLASTGIGGDHVIRVAAAGAAAWFAYRGWRTAAGRERRVRGWIGFAAVVWFVSEVGRLGGEILEVNPILAEASVVGLAVGAIGTYVSVARGRLRPADETGLYLDAAAIFASTTGAVLVLGATLVTDPTGIAVLAHAAFFVAIVASTLLLDLTTRAPFRFVGQWELLAGLALGAVGYVGLLTTVADGPARTAMHVLVAGGALLVGHGGSHWTSAQRPVGRYEAIAAWLRGLLPLPSVILVTVLIVTLVTQPALVEGGLRIAAAVALGLAVVCTIARQTILLADREHVIRRERQLTDELTVAEAQYRSVVERVPGVVYVAESGQHGRWHFVSAKITEMLGYSPEEWTSDPTLWITRIHPTDRERMLLAEAGGERVEPRGRWEYRLIARDGRIVWVIDDEAVISRDADGHATMVQGILVDITDRKDLEEQLRHQALHDPLTGLPNRVLFVDRLSHSLLRRRQSDGGVAVLFLDLDDFKGINDTLGHAAGDELLQLIANRLSGVLRAEDTACRLGGDEFAFLLEGVTQAQAEEVAGRVLTALAQPFELNGRRVSLTGSIGLASRDRVSDPRPAETADEILRDADTAMYASKSLGKGRIRVFQRGMREPVSRRRELRSALERALHGDELFLEYQPVIDMASHALTGLEALVRWEHPQLGRLAPAEFVPLSEESGLIRQLGEWVMRRACADLADGSTPVSVNVSAHQLGGGELPLLVDNVLAASGLPASRLMLELTESTLASAGAGAEVELQRVQSLGVKIALDDFGSGYSSLEYLGRLPIDILKIDRSLVERVHLEPQREEVMRAISHIAEKLGLETIVEGVEHEAQRTTLLELGFRQAQGFLFAAPLPLEVALAPRLVRKAS